MTFIFVMMVTLFLLGLHVFRISNSHLSLKMDSFSLVKGIAKFRQKVDMKENGTG